MYRLGVHEDSVMTDTRDLSFRTTLFPATVI